MTNYDLGNQIKETLLEPEQKAAIKAINTLRLRNADGLTNVGFMFNGVIYRNPETKGVAPVITLQLHLVDEMVEVNKLLSKSKQEVQAIWQALLPMLETYEPENALPDSLKTALPTTFPKRTIDFETMMAAMPRRTSASWKEVEPTMNYHLSLRLAL